jgi:hypothetical protein
MSALGPRALVWTLRPPSAALLVWLLTGAAVAAPPGAAPESAGRGNEDCVPDPVTEGESVRDKLQQLRSRILQLARLSGLKAESAARILKVKVGPPRPAVSNPTVHVSKIKPTDLIAGGAVTTTKKAIYIEVVPAAGLQVALSDFETQLQDCRYSRHEVQAHVGPELESRVSDVLHLFVVKAGGLTLEEAPVPDGERAVIRRIVVDDDPNPWVQKAPTLREQRAPKRRAPVLPERP